MDVCPLWDLSVSETVSIVTVESRDSLRCTGCTWSPGICYNFSDNLLCLDDSA